MTKIKQTINYFLKHKKTLNFIVVLLCFSLSFFLFANYAYAGPIEDAIYLILNSFMSAVLAFLATGISALVVAVVWVAQINNFTNAPAVNDGWEILLNLSNMFFILILLIIAFATILRVESYNAKKLLPRLLIMAVLVNFSKIICGLIIDAAQIVMLTFVASFADINGFNFVNLMGLNEIINFDKDSSKAATSVAIFSAYVLGIIYILISTVVMAVLLAVLVYRVVMIWIYVVLSPLAYLMAAFPQGQGYAKQWWSDFLGHVTVGPVLAFFIWLSFMSMGSGVTGQADLSKILPSDSSSRGQEQILENAPKTLTKAGSVDHMIKFAIAIGMLIGGLMIAQKSGGLAGKAAGSGLAALKRMQSGATKPFRSGASMAKNYGVERVKGTAGRALNTAGKVLQVMPTDSLKALGKATSGLGGDIKKTRADNRAKSRLKVLQGMGFRSDSKSLEDLDKFSDTALARHLKTGLGVTGALALGAATGGVGTFVSGVGVAAGLQGARTVFAEAGRKETKKKKDEDENITKGFKKTRDDNIKQRTTTIEKQKNLELNTIEEDKNIKLKDFEAKNGKFSSNPLPKGEYDKGIKDIEDSFSKRIEDITDSYDNQLKNIKPEEESKYQESIRGDKGTRLGKLEKVRDEDLEKIKLNVEARIKKIESEDLEEPEKTAQINKVRLAGEKEEKKVTDKYRADQKLLDGPTNSRLVNALADYHPMKVTKAAIKKETGSTQTVLAQIKALAGGKDISKFAGSTFYAQSGFNPVNQKFFDQMKESNQEAKDAMLKVLDRVKYVSSIQAQSGEMLPKDGDVTKSDLSNLESLKEGLAALMVKGEDTSKFSEIIAELDKITTKESEGTRTVESYKDSVIVPK